MIRHSTYRSIRVKRILLRRPHQFDKDLLEDYPHPMAERAAPKAKPVEKPSDAPLKSFTTTYRPPRRRRKEDEPKIPRFWPVLAYLGSAIIFLSVYAKTLSKIR